MKKYDLHVHTNYSPCSTNKPDKILKQAKKKGLSGIAVTDHNTMRGAIELKKLNKNKNFDIIIGEEIETEIGHILAYYLKKEIKPGRFNKIIKEIKKQKAIGVLAHPYNYDHPIKQMSGFFGKMIFGLEKNRKSVQITPKNIKLLKKLDAIEGFNSRCMLQKENLDAHKLAKKLGLAAIAGSDSHFPNEIGNAYVEFSDNLSLREAIKERKLKIKGRHTPILSSKIKIALNLARRFISK